MINGHMETIIPSMFFKVEEVDYQRERLELPDTDFLDLDWLENANDRLIILSHGLEGSSERYYVKRSAKYFAERGWDVLAWNCRSCSGEMNRLPRFYHHGDSDDLGHVIDHALKRDYSKVVLMGYSMGGSMSLKYLGEERPRDERIIAAATFSVPVNLKDSSDQLEKKGNKIYEKRFLKKLKEKIRLKAEQHPDKISTGGLDEMKDFNEFHERYTVPLHGFNSIQQFFDSSTCDQYLDRISVPVLIGNAFNDPMLGEKCYPYKLASESNQVHLEVSKNGGHVGFTYMNRSYSWMESRAEQFINEFC